jgi:CRP-like cAMP-binding protein
MFSENALLHSLGKDALSHLSVEIKLIKLPLKSYALKAHEPINWVYFPKSALASLITTDAGGQSVETSMVGREGAVGLLEACGSRISRIDGLIQIDGEAWRAPAELCRQLARSDPDFGSLVLRHAELQMAEARRSAFCQAVHKAPQRMARWLLESLERSGGRNPMPVTQEFLSAMLGVQRTSVTLHARVLQRKGAINYSRGSVQVVNVAGLRQASCSCHAYMKAQRAALGFEA